MRCRDRALSTQTLHTFSAHKAAIRHMDSGDKGGPGKSSVLGCALSLLSLFLSPHSFLALTRSLLSLNAGAAGGLSARVTACSAALLTRWCASSGRRCSQGLCLRASQVSDTWGWWGSFIRSMGCMSVLVHICHGYSNHCMRSLPAQTPPHPYRHPLTLPAASLTVPASCRLRPHTAWHAPSLHVSHLLPLLVTADATREAFSTLNTLLLRPRLLCYLLPGCWRQGICCCF